MMRKAAVLLGTLLLLHSNAFADESVVGETTDQRLPLVIIIDDMGYNLALGKQALTLPGPLAFSFLPGTPYARRLAQRAHREGKQVLLHLPMQGRLTKHDEIDSLNAQMSEIEFKQTLQRHLAAVPYISGVNNHMGSELTPLTQQMDWLMQELAQRQLFFIDSRTTPLTVAKQSADAFNVEFLQRDVFLDNIKTEQAIRTAFARFMRVAGQRQGAIAIAHPHPLTLNVLQQLLLELPMDKYRLASIDDLLKRSSNADDARLARVGH